MHAFRSRHCYQSPRLNTDATAPGDSRGEDTAAHRARGGGGRAGRATSGRRANKRAPARASRRHPAARATLGSAPPPHGLSAPWVGERGAASATASRERRSVVAPAGPQRCRAHHRLEADLTRTGRV